MIHVILISTSIVKCSEIILYCVNFTIAIKIKMIDFNSIDTMVGGHNIIALERSLSPSVSCPNGTLYTLVKHVPREGGDEGSGARD